MWAGQAAPAMITMENVKQIRNWGPLVAKRCKATGRVVTLERITCPRTGKAINRVAEPGERVPVQNQFLIPDPKRKGKTWRAFLKHLRGLGYQVEHQLLRACDYGAPTIRRRLFLIARRDGLPIVINVQAAPPAAHATRASVCLAASLFLRAPSISVSLFRRRPRSRRSSSSS